MHDGRAKLFVTWKALQFRSAYESVFRDGEYIPLRVTGEYAANVCAFAAAMRELLVITVVPRLYLRLLGEGPA